MDVDPLSTPALADAISELRDRTSLLNGAASAETVVADVAPVAMLVDDAASGPTSPPQPAEASAVSEPPQPVEVSAVLAEPPPPPAAAASELASEIEKVVAHRLDAWQIDEYKVQWKNGRAPTWVPRAQLATLSLQLQADQLKATWPQRAAKAAAAKEKAAAKAKAAVEQAAKEAAADAEPRATPPPPARPQVETPTTAVPAPPVPAGSMTAAEAIAAARPRASRCCARRGRSLRGRLRTPPASAACTASSCLRART